MFIVHYSLFCYLPTTTFAKRINLSSGAFAQSEPVSKSYPATRFIRFFPNPAVSIINFEFERGFEKTFTFDIYNFIGKKVYSAKAVTSKMNVPLTDFFRGVYILNYRKQNELTSRKVAYLCNNNYKPLTAINRELQFATAVTMFGLVLRESKNISFIDLAAIETIGLQSANKEDYLQNEFLQLVAKAKVFYPKKKKKKKRSVKFRTAAD